MEITMALRQNTWPDRMDFRPRPFCCGGSARHPLLYSHEQVRASRRSAPRPSGFHGSDPSRTGGPNAYVGRSLAYNFMGDETASLKDKETAQSLGGAERSAWDRLVNRANRRWQGNLSDKSWKDEDPLSHKAVLLHQWVGQIFNGGLPQWVANGYGAWVEELAQAAQQVGTDGTRAVARVIRDVAGVLTRWPGARESMFRMLTVQTQLTKSEDDLFEALSQCEADYHRVGTHFSANVEAWFEEQAKKAR